MLHRLIVSLFAILVAICFITGCSSEPGDDCLEGTEDCPCYPNDTCDEGLDCEDGICIDPDAPDDNDDNDDNDNDDNDTPTGSGESVTETVDADGGSVSVGDATVSIPEGAVDEEVEITMTELEDPAPGYYDAYSPVYKFEPQGLEFAEPVELSIGYEGSRTLAAMFWSSDDGEGYERLGGIPTSDVVTAEVDHFSEGFIADGVDFDEPADRSCVVTRILDEPRPVDPSGVGLFFAMDDCEGRPITDLQLDEIDVLESGESASIEAQSALMDRDGLEVFVTIGIELTVSTQQHVDDIVEGAHAFMDQIDDLGVRAQVSVKAFAGEEDLHVLQDFTLEHDDVRDAIDELAVYEPGDLSSTNLYGGLIEKLETSRVAQNDFKDRNFGGAFTSGHILLFTDGRDTAARASEAEALAALENSHDEIHAVALSSSADYEPETIDKIAPRSSIESPDTETFEREFGRLGARLAGQVSRTYLLGYCSPARDGEHSVEVIMDGADNTLWGEPPVFDAEGFEAGCTPETFEGVCEGKECGGLGCGGCDDRVEFCGGGDWEGGSLPEFIDVDDRDNECVNYCRLFDYCEGQGFVLPEQDYEVICEEQEPTWVGCDGQCVDLTENVDHCGACENACYECDDGICICDPDSELEACNNTCVNTDTDPNHCGECGNECSGDTPYCIGGTCQYLLQVSAARNYTCGVATGGDVICWGSDSSDQFSPPSGEFEQVSAGSHHTCGVKVGGEVECWGDNDDGQSSPPSGEFEQVSAGDSHTCGVKVGGEVECWGSEFSGESSPPSGEFEQVSAGRRHTCGVKPGGAVECWGSDSWDQSSPPSGEFEQVSAGYSHTCGVKIGGEVECWGYDDDSPSGEFEQVSTGGTTTMVYICGVKMGGDIECWGYSQTVSNASPPSGEFEQVSAGVSHACGVKPGGEVECWGDDDFWESSPRFDRMRQR